MVYGVLRFINFAHSDVLMLGAFAAFFLAPAVGKILPPQSLSSAMAIVILAAIICAVIGMLIEFLAYRPLRHRPKLTVLITAIGVSLFLEYTGQLPIAFGADYRTFPTLLTNRPLLEAGGLYLASNDVIIFVVAIVLMVTLRIIVMKTKVGTAMRAVSMNMNAASLMGININRVISFTFFVGSALAGAGAILFSMSYPKINPLMGILPGLKAFVAAVLGGIGHIPGAAAGGFLIGIAETLTAGYISPGLRDAIVFGILILILLLKPSGLFGRGGAEKV